MKVVASMAGITDGDFLANFIDSGFNTLTLGGYNIDKSTLNAGIKITKRGRKEFTYPLNEIHGVISHEVNKLKNINRDILVSANLRSIYPEAIVLMSKIPFLDIVEINCHCRQDEFLEIGCGQAMLMRDDLKDFISFVVRNADSKVSVKIRANVDGVDSLEVSKLIASCGVDYLHIDAMKVGVDDADYELLSKISSKVDTFIIGNNSINSSKRVFKILDTGVQGFSIGRALMNGSLDFEI